MKKILAVILALALLLGLGLPVQAESVRYSNETLVTWCGAYTSYLMALADVFEGEYVDMALANGSIIYREREIAYGPSGVPVIHGAAFSENGTVMLGNGSGLDGYEDHWYASLTFSPEASELTVYLSSMAFIMASGEVGFELPEDAGEMMAKAEELLTVLLSAESIAVEADGLVFVGKQLSDGRTLLAVDTVAYYDEFYYNDTDNYLIMD